MKIGAFLKTKNDGYKMIFLFEGLLVLVLRFGGN